MFTNRRGARWSSLLLSVLFPQTAVLGLLQMQMAVSLASPAPSPTTAFPLDAVVGEIAWMGTTTDSNDEWLELVNNTATNIDLAGWRLISSDGTPTIALSGVLPAHGRLHQQRHKISDGCFQV